MQRRVRGIQGGGGFTVETPGGGEVKGGRLK